MAKQLRNPVPSSSIARLFDMQTAASAVAGAPKPRHDDLTPRVAAAPATPAASDTRSVSLANVDEPKPDRVGFVKRELVLTPAADETLTRLVELFRRVTGARLSASHVARAMLRGVAHAMPALEEQVACLGPMKLPSNARNRAGERERFEACLADSFVAGFTAAAAESKG